MRSLRSLFSRGQTSAPSTVDHVNGLRAVFARLDDAALDAAAQRASTLPEVIAATSVIASRELGFVLHDEQLQAAVTLAAGRIVEMQTGEGKTVAAVPAVVWFAKAHGGGVHVLTANDYLAGRDAAWMAPIYRRAGLTVASIHQGMTPSDRRAAYRADVTYATANEVGFDYLRDGLAFDTDDVVHRPFAGVTAVIDEADSILIDEARIPLVIAGGATNESRLPVLADRAVRELLGGHHYTVEQAGRNVLLTPAGVQQIERVAGVPNLFDPDALATHAAVQDALHAHVLLRRDVDYVVQEGKVLSVDELKGRIVAERRWPAGLQTALECKEGVLLRTQGRVLGSITVEHLIAMYARVCGMTGTARTQADEFRQMYDLDVVTLPTHRPVVRVDAPDRFFATKAEKEAAVVEDILRRHATGQPVLVGTASVEESERLSRRLGALPHHVLNARHEAREAAIVARAGERGAVTISTNMAGRGVDIQLADGVAALGGLHVIGTNRHESRRIDHQLRGRSGRQGDPGSSEFFVSREDPLFVTFAADDPGIESEQAQRMAEGRNLDIRLFLRKYESVIEGQRLAMRDRRDAVLSGEAADPVRRRVTLEVLDELWSDYLAAVADLRAGTPWQTLGNKDPHTTYLAQVHAMFEEMTRSIDDEVAARLADPASTDAETRSRGATWTYLTTDEPFGPFSARVIRGILRRFRKE